MKNLEFCAYFDHRYFDHGVALYTSLMRHCPGARLWVLCLSEECHRAITALALPNLVPVALAEFEAGNSALAAAKANRSTIEYYFTCTPSLMDWIFKRDPEIGVLTYLDTDMFFFSSPMPIFQAFEGYSSLIIGHRFPPALKKQEIYGKYNVGWISFRRDRHGLDCLTWWRDRCLEWCYDELDGDRFADQKYLDRFPEMFEGVLVLENPGANLAPWNMASHHLEACAGDLLVDGQPLIFFHFHNFKRVGPFWHTRHRENAIKRQPFLARALYRPYIKALAAAAEQGTRVGVRREKMLRQKYSRYQRVKNVAKMLIHGEYVLNRH